MSGNVELKEKVDAFSLSLEENAADSLNHALEHVIDGKLNSIKYMIMHSHHAVELFLKARLAKAHFTLIYEKPEAAENPNAKTVDFKTLIGRLQTIGVKLTEEELGHLSILKEKRNAIEHHKVSIDLEEGRLYVGRALRFLEEFVSDQLKKDIAEIVTQEGFEALVKEFYSYEERVDVAKQQLELLAPDIRDGGEYEVFDCESCGEETMVAPSVEVST